jgi:hypothetical protein
VEKKLFRDPPMWCRSAPFWSWNGKLTPEETRWQVREMVDKGMGGGFMHARFGLDTEYLGEEWFASVAASISEGKKLGFFSWIYDEDCWPSGNCAGRTAAANPDFRVRCLFARRGQDVVIPPGARWEADGMTFLGCFRVIEEAGSEPRFVEAPESDAGYPDVLAFYASSFPKLLPSDEHYADLMHDEGMREFIRNSYEPYAERFRKEFGKAVPGIFTDEPQLQTALTWSVRLPAEFQKRRGYDLLKKLPHLLYKTSESGKVRHDFWKTVYELVDESFTQQIGEWCEKNNVRFTGHLNAEGALQSQIQCAGGVMHHYKHMQAPGIDILCEKIEEIITCKQTSSVASQFGRERVLSELYGCTGYHFSFEGQRWIGDWQMALGINLLCQHLTYYTMKGPAKRDYPPSYNYQTPWWRHYRHIADYQARLSYVLLQGAPVRDILLLHPLTSAWMRYDPSAPNRDLGEMDAGFKQIMKNLLDLQRDYDLGDEWLLAEHGSVEGAELVLGLCRYKAVIVPPVANLEKETVELLEKFAAAGGKVIFMHPLPACMDGAASPRPGEAAHRDGVMRIGTSRRHLKETLDVLLPAEMSVVNRDTGREPADVLVQMRRERDQSLLFVVNTDRDRAAPLRLRLNGRGAWRRWDCVTGEITPVASVQAGGASEVEFDLPPAGSIVLTREPGRAAAQPVKAWTLKSESVLAMRNGWNFRRVAPNSLVLDRCTWRLDDHPWEGPAFTSALLAECRKRLGIFHYGGSSMTAYQPWKVRQDPENLKPRGVIARRYPLSIDALPNSELYLVLEDRAETEVFVNGERVDAPATGWFMDKSFEKVAIGGFVKRGENVIETRMTVNACRYIEDMYVIGEFGVDASTFALTREPKRLAVGDWCPQGYPFYTDAMVYETELDLPAKPKGKVEIDLPVFEGPVAAVWVNDEKAAVIGWLPYVADITRFLKAGVNSLGIEIVGTPRNLMGPRHLPERHPPWTGPGQMADTTESIYQIAPAGMMGDPRIRFYE